MNGMNKKVSPVCVIDHCKVYIDHDAKVIVAVSRYAGKTVRGVAKCHPNDEFNTEFGIKLAVARCNIKVAKKRAARADSRVIDALNAKFEAVRFVEDMKQYQKRAQVELANALNDLKELEDSNV